MKTNINITLIVLILSGIIGLFPKTLNAQNYSGIVLSTHFDYQKINESEHKFIFITSFSLGSADNCPPVVNTEISLINDTLFVKNFYDIRGAWPFYFCEQTNEYFYNQFIPLQAKYIKMSTNIITYDEYDPNDIMIVYDVYYKIFDLSSTLAPPSKATEKISIYPNPVNNVILINSDKKLESYSIFNSIGQLIEERKIEDKNYINIGHLSAGLYCIVLQDRNQKRHHFKFIKK